MNELARDIEAERERGREYYATNREKIRERKRKWRRANPENGREYARKYYWAHLEKRIEYSRKYRETNLEKIRESTKKYYWSNPEAGRERVRKWRLANLEKAKTIRRKRYAANPEAEREYVRKYREDNPEKAKASVNKWRDANPEKVKTTRRKYRTVNRERINTNRARYHKARMLSDEPYYIKCRLRNLLSKAFKRYSTTGKLKKSSAYGVDFEAIVKYLGHCPGNRKDYHIDHIKPLCSFDFNNPEQIRLACVPENHQWLTAEKNIRKGGFYE